MYIYICIHAYIDMNIHTYTYKYMYAWIYICIHMHIYVHIHICVYVCICTYVYIYLHNSCMRAYATVQKLLCHGKYCKLILSLARASCRLSFATRPPAVSKKSGSLTTITKKHAKKFCTSNFQTLMWKSLYFWKTRAKRW